MVRAVSARTKKLLDEVLALPPEEALALAYEVLDTLEDDLDDEDTPEKVEKAWPEELERRIDDVVAGRVKARDANDVLAQLDAKHAGRR
jgi:putative addiction module component (TIGR02574 family)